MIQAINNQQRQHQIPPKYPDHDQSVGCHTNLLCYLLLWYVIMINNNNNASNQSLEKKLLYFSDDPLLPVYQPDISTLEASKVIADEIINGVNPELIAKLVPHQLAVNVNFVIGLWKDVLSDNFGIWNANGTKTHHYTPMLNRNTEFR